MGKYRHALRRILDAVRFEPRRGFVRFGDVVTVDLAAGGLLRVEVLKAQNVVMVPDEVAAHLIESALSTMYADDPAVRRIIFDSAEAVGVALF